MKPRRVDRLADAFLVSYTRLQIKNYGSSEVRCWTQGGYRVFLVSQKALGRTQLGTLLHCFFFMVRRMQRRVGTNRYPPPRPHTASPLSPPSLPGRGKSRSLPLSNWRGLPDATEPPSAPLQAAPFGTSEPAPEPRGKNPQGGAEVSEATMGCTLRGSISRSKIQNCRRGQSSQGARDFASHLGGGGQAVTPSTQNWIGGEQRTA